MPTLPLARSLAAVAGVLLVLIGLVRPTGGAAAQTALHPVPDELLVRGERLFNYGLVGHGLALLGWAALAGRTRRSDPEPLFTPSVSAPAAGWVLVAVLGLAVVLRFIGLDTGLWYDEVVTLTEFVRLPLPELVRNYADQNQHPLYSVAARLSVVALGESALALRLPAVLFGVASLGAVYALARRLTPRPEPLLTTLLLTVSYHHVWFSQNARGYTALLFWTVLASLLLVENLGRPRWSLTVAYSVVSALALYTHLTAAFFLAAHGLVYLFLVGRKAHAGRRLAATDGLPLVGFVLAGTLAFQLYAPVLPQVFGTFRTQTGSTRVQGWTDLSWGATQVLRGLTASFAGTAGAVVAAAVVATGLASFVRRDPMVVALLVIPCVLGLGVMLLLNRHLYPRFFFPACAFGMMVVVRGTLVIGETVWRRRGGVALAGLMIAASAVSLWPGYRHPKQDYAAALAYVDAVRHPDDPVVTVGMAAIPITRYFAPTVPAADTAAELAAIRANHPGRPTWLVYTFPDHLASFHPDIRAVVDREFVCTRMFPGTVGGGAVLVGRGPPTPPSP